MPNIFIDGQVGTTGLQILDRLKKRDELQIIEIPTSQRKDLEAKKQYLNNADLVILCLPDEAARESVSMITNVDVKILDASTAHRVDSDWVYGLPELNPGQRSKIQSAKRVSNPGCYPTGFLLAVTPLIKDGLLPSDYPITVNAVSGYSGGGRKLIETYQRQEKEHPDQLWSYRKYGLNLVHKHIPEMVTYAGLDFPPLFEPAVGHFNQGMLVSIPLHPRLMAGGVSPADIHSSIQAAYRDEPFISVKNVNTTETLDSGFISPTELNGTNEVDIFVFGNERQIVLIARLDNLGKGASGAAVQNLNLMLGFEEDRGLKSY